MQNNAEYLERFKRKIRLKMDNIFDAYLAPDIDFPVTDSPIWVFGRSYSTVYDRDELRRSVSSCLWVTYRKNFPTVGDTSFTSDRGWGCMIRTGQMVIAKAILLRHLGPDWHWDCSTKEPIYLQIVSLFGDTRLSPLGLHQIAQSGASLGKPIGSWLGPNTVCQALYRLLSSDSINVDLQMFIAMDSTLVKSEVKRVCYTPAPLSSATSHNYETSTSITTPRPEPNWKPLLLIVPLRLGLSDLNQSYTPGIKVAFEIEQNIGIIGGRPNHALYFIGYAEDEVLYLDPHTVQTAAAVGSKNLPPQIEADLTYHIEKPGRMSFLAMDPSVAICFYCKTEADFDDLCVKLSERFKHVPLPLFEICETPPCSWTSPTVSSKGFFTPSPTLKEGSFTYLGAATSSKSPHSNSPSLSPRKSDAEDEEFEILG